MKNQELTSHSEPSQPKEQLELLLKEQSSLLSLFDKGDSILFRWKNDKDWSVEYVSQNINRLVGYDKAEFLNHNILYASLIHHADLPRVMREVEEALECNLDFFRHEPYRIITQKGEERWVLDHTVTQKDDHNTITHFIGYITDITQQINLQHELQ